MSETTGWVIATTGNLRATIGLCFLETIPALSAKLPMNGQRRTADDRPRGRADTILICILTGLSGAITGFVFAGQFAVAGGAYAALILGGVLGWLARGAVA